MVLVARSVEKLDRLARQLNKKYQVQVWVEPADLSRRTVAKTFAADVRKQCIEIDVLVSNVGVLEHESFIDMPKPDHKRLIDLNVSGLTNMLTNPGTVYLFPKLRQPIELS